MVVQFDSSSAVRDKQNERPLPHQTKEFTKESPELVVVLVARSITNTTILCLYSCCCMCLRVVVVVVVVVCVLYQACGVKARWEKCWGAL